MTRCKHGMIPNTCAFCSGLVVPIGELHLLWIDFVDVDFEIDVEKSKQRVDKNTWFKARKSTLIQRFLKKHGRVPPFPTWPEK